MSSSVPAGVVASTLVSLHFPSLRWVDISFSLSFVINSPINCLFFTGVVLDSILSAILI